MTYSTYKRYAGIVGKHLKPALGHRKLKDVTRVEVRKLYAAKSETLSPRSVDYIHITLQKALSQAVRRPDPTQRGGGRTTPRHPPRVAEPRKGALPRPSTRPARRRAGHAKRGALRRRLAHGLAARRAVGAQVVGPRRRQGVRAPGAKDRRPRARFRTPEEQGEPAVRAPK